MSMLRGALIEYGTGLIGPIPNVVIFQFNPESLSRTLQIPPRPTGATQRETTQAGEKTFEKITFKAHFSAANMLADDKVLARLFGIGPQLAALEKMVLPSSKLAGPDRRRHRRDRRRARPRRRRRRAGPADPAREVSAHPVHLGPDPRAAGDDRLDDASPSWNTTSLLNPLRAEVDISSA